jgi:IclR family transcriptional regulator, acetate operon repressor
VQSAPNGLTALPTASRKPTSTDEEGMTSAPTFPLVPAVTKAIDVIRFLNERGMRGGSLSEMAEQLHINRSHCHNILRTLVHCQWLSYDAPSRTYRLTSNLPADVSSALVSRPYFNEIQPHVQRLADEIGLPCILSEPISDGSFLVVLTANQSDPFVFSVPVGFRFPAGSPPHFKAALAWLPAEQQEAALARWKPIRYTKTTITNVDAMRRELAATRKRGFARSIGEFTEGFTTILLPIFARAGDVFLILQLAGLSEAVSPREIEVAEALARAVAGIHRAIDGRPPIDFPTGTRPAGG